MQLIGLIGLGEAGSILAQDLAAASYKVCAYDRLLLDARQAEALAVKARSNGFKLAASAADAVRDSELVISAVTAGSAGLVGQQLAPHLRPGQYYVDLNSVAPETKRSCADLVEAAGAHYIDCAVMGAFAPTRLRTAMLLSGRHASKATERLTAAGFNVRMVGDAVGMASAIKMCRSIMIKGLEALTAECLRGARRYGAEELVLASLADTFPGMGWDAGQADYLLSRIAVHGHRRAEEMVEVCRTLADVGVNPRMSQAIARTQFAVAESISARSIEYTIPFDWRRLVDDLLD